MPRNESNCLPVTTILSIAAMLMIVLAFPRGAWAETSANASSPLGINLSRVNYFSSEQPFLNIFKTSGASNENPKGWITYSPSKFDTGEEAYLQLDPNGYPTTLQAKSADDSPKYTAVGALILRGLPNSDAGAGLPYRAGKYVVLYDGEGTLAYNFDAHLVSHSPGRDIVDVARPTTGGGFLLLITSTDPNHNGKYIHNIRVVKAEEETLLSQGQVFTPKFLTMLQNFHVVRFMQWSEIDNDGGMAGNWANRTHYADAGWGGPDGVPLEVDVQLANTVGADPWLDVPVNADDNYITQMATLVHSSLTPGLRVYVEFSNEVWNSGYPQYNYAAQQGKATWPSAGVSGNEYNRNWFGMRTAKMCDIWKSVWGADYSHVTCVLGAQAANTQTATESLKCPLWKGSGNAPCSAHNITAVAIAPYFLNFKAPATWARALDVGLSDIFQQANVGGLLSAGASGAGSGDMATVSGWEMAYNAALAPYHLPFVAYEGGQSLVDFPNPQGAAVEQLYARANRDPRMGTAYTSALNAWKAAGGQAYVLYDDIDAPSMYGEWGALESFMDPVVPLSASSSKWQAIQNFINANPCWWSGCESSVTANVPMAPANFKAAN